MMYEAYEKKVRKYLPLAQILKACVKGAVVLLILAAIALLGYLALRGIHFGSFALESETVAFGDKPAYDCFVLFGTYRCEYARPGSEVWMEDQPTAPGTYAVRAVITKGFFGKQVYSEVGTVTLYQRNVTLTPSTKFGASVPYGQSPEFGKHWEISSSLLAKGHKVEKASLRHYEYDGSGNIVCYVDVSSVVIRDRKGNDVTAGYILHEGSGSVKVKAKQITVAVANEVKNGKPVNITKVYDGQSGSTSNYELTSGSLRAGDRLVVISTNTNTAAGRHDNTAQVRVVGSNGEDRTMYYNIKVNVCKIIIEKRPLSVTTSDVTLEYTGQMQYHDGYTITSGSLVSGHVALAVHNAKTGVTEVTSRPAEHKVQLQIMQGNTDVTKNYDITYEYGSLTVNKRMLRVRTEDSQGLVYNGKEQSWTGFRIISGSLASGHSLVSKSAAKQKVPGSCVNEVTYEIRAGDGKDVTKNYDFTVEYGTLSVEKGAPLALGLKALSKTYDASALDPANFEPSELISIISGELFAGDTIEITDTHGSQTNVGSSAYTVEYRIMHKEGMGQAVDATSWYTGGIAAEGTLAVKPYTVTIKFDPITKQYDGKAAVPEAPDLKDSTLASFEGVGHRIVLAPGAMQALTYRQGSQVTNEAVATGKYTYTVPLTYISVVLDDGSGADRTANYEFKFSGNTVHVQGVSLTLEAPSDSKQYDGTPLSAEYFSPSLVKETWGASGYTVSYSLTGSQTDAGVGTVSFSNVVVRNGQGLDVTENFEIKTVTGKLTVTPIALSVRSSSGSKVYDGKPMENATQMELISGSLVEGHVLGGAVNPDYVTDVGTHENNKVTPKVYSATGKDVSRNYQITVKAGRYTVTTAPLHVTAPVVTGEYSGMPYSGKCDATAYAQGLAQGQRVELDVVSDGIELGMHPMQVVGCSIVDGRGRDVSGNYDISYSDGEIEIVPRKIRLITGSSTVSFEQVPAVNTSFTVGGSGLVQGHVVRATFTYPNGIYEIGSVANTLENVRVVDESGRDVTAYYEISYQNGSLRVKPIEVTLQTGSNYKEVYDGLPISSLEYEVTDGYFLKGHALQAYLKYAEGVCDVGEWKNEFASIRVYDADGKEVTYMYHFTVDAGVLEIEKPYRLSMTSYDAEKVYDGMPLSNDQYLIAEELIAGHTVYRVIPVTLERAGTAENRITLGILDQNGHDVSRNYEFYYQEETLGILTVTPRPMTVTVGKVELTYNGTLSLMVPQTQLVLEGLVQGQRVSQTVLIPTPEIGHKPNAQIGEVRVYNLSGRDVTDCYEIVVQAGELDATVLPAELSLYLPSRYTKEYDGTGVTVLQAGYRPVGLAAGHQVVYEATEAMPQPGLYTLEFTSWTVYDQSGNDVTSNYVVTPDACTVNIYSRQLKLTSGSASRHYNGTELVCHELLDYTLPEGYTIDVVFTGSQTEVGSSKNTFTVTVYDPSGEDVTAYWSIKPEYGTLEVWDQYLLELYSGSATKIYDGTELVCHELSDYILPEGYTLEVIFSGAQTLPGESENSFAVYVYDPSGEKVNQSFRIVTYFGTLRVLEKSEDWVVTLTSKSASKGYDGTPLICHELEPYELPEGFELEVIFTGEQTELGRSQNTFTARAYNEQGQELTVICEYGTLEVSLDVTVNAYEMTYTYDGTEKNCEDVWVQGLPEGFWVDVTFGAGLVVTGSKNVEIERVTVYDQNGTDVTNLCKLTVNTARLTVQPRILTVYVYGQSADSIAPVQGSLVKGHTMFAEYGESGECYIEITDENGALVYSNRGDSPIKHVLYDVIIQYG